MQSSPIDLKRGAEAARYALLRRLAPAIRHDMAGGFQPVTMLATIIEKRLLNTSPDMPALIKNSGEMRSLAIAATHSNLNLMGWMVANPEARVALSKGIQDVLHLVMTELSFRGLKFVNQTEGMSTDVKLDHVHGTFVAALLALTDAVTSPANVQITAAQEGQDMLIEIKITDVKAASDASAPSEEFRIGLAAYRKIDWADAQTIADEDGLHLKNESGSVILRLPILST